MNEPTPPNPGAIELVEAIANALAAYNVVKSHAVPASDTFRARDFYAIQREALNRHADALQSLLFPEKTTPPPAPPPPPPAACHAANDRGECPTCGKPTAPPDRVGGTHGRPWFCKTCSDIPF